MTPGCVSLGVVNPTAVHGKSEVLSQLNCDVLTCAETSTTAKCNAPKPDGGTNWGTQPPGHTGSTWVRHYRPACLYVSILPFVPMDFPPFFPIKNSSFGIVPLDFSIGIILEAILPTGFGFPLEFLHWKSPIELFVWSLSLWSSP